MFESYRDSDQCQYVSDEEKRKRRKETVYRWILHINYFFMRSMELNLTWFSLMEQPLVPESGMYTIELALS